MRHRTVVVVALFAVSTGSAAAPAADGDIPRTPSGKPDLSGTYDISNLTPFERPPKYGEQLFLSREEAEAIRTSTAARRAAAGQSSDPERDAPPAGGDVGSYNDFWYDFGEGALPIEGRYRTSILTDPADGRMPPLTDAGRARLAHHPQFAYPNTGDAWWIEKGDDPYDGPESLVLWVRCIYLAPATVPARPLPYNNFKRIVQTDSHVMLLVEWMHWARVVRLDSEHLPDDIRSFGGDSIGWWEGDTLVVETTNFLEWPGVPREGLRVIERFRPVDGTSLVYQFTVEDSDYSAPYSGEMLWPKTDARLYEYACHEGNYSMGGTLRGARLLEREWDAKHGDSAGSSNE